MAGDAYLIEETLQLTDDGGHLRGQVIRVHGCHQRAMTSHRSGTSSFVVLELSWVDERERRDGAERVGNLCQCHERGKNDR